jgi:hypothetical protein
MESFTLGPTLKIDFARTVEHTLATARELGDLQIVSSERLTEPSQIVSILPDVRTVNAVTHWKVVPYFEQQIVRQL